MFLIVIAQEFIFWIDWVSVWEEASSSTYLKVFKMWTTCQN